MRNEQDTSLRITMRDLMAVGFCPAGVRHWFTLNNKDFRVFMRDGATVEELGAHDAFVQKAAKQKASKQKVADHGR